MLARALAFLLLVLPAVARAASLPTPNIDTFALFALESLSSHHLDVINGDIGVNDGVLRARAGLSAPHSTIVADLADLSDPSTCANLVSNVAHDVRCAVPQPFDGVWIDDPVAACGFQTIKSCTDVPGRPQTVQENGRINLTPGNYGALSVKDGATVHLQAGTYRFCGVRLGKEVRLIPDGPTRVNVFGDLRIGDRSNVGTAANGFASDIKFFTTGTRVDLQKNILVLAEVCAPNAIMLIRNQANLHGRYVAREIRTHDVTVTRSKCGDGHREGTEQCDGSAFGGFTCPGGSAGGAFACPACRTDCTVDTSCCPGGGTTSTTSTSRTTSTTSTTIPHCGDGIRQGTEECDGLDLGGAVCDPSSPANCNKCTPSCTIDRNCCRPVLPPQEICGDCIDNDGDGLIDFEDPDCCATTSPLTIEAVTIGRASDANALQRLRVQARFTPRAPTGFNPRTEGTTLQISDSQGTVFCQSIPFQANRSSEAVGEFHFADKTGTLAAGLRSARLRYRSKKQGPAVIEAKGKNMTLRPPANNPVRITVRVGNRCARVLTTLQSKGHQGQLTFP